MVGNAFLVVMDSGLQQQAERLAVALSTHLPPPRVEVASGMEQRNGLPLLTYTDTTKEKAERTKRFVQQTYGRCCVVVGAHEDFPFIGSLRQRAREALGEVEIIEMPSKGGSEAQLLKVAEKLQEMNGVIPPAQPVAATDLPPPTSEAPPAAAPAQEAKPTPAPAEEAKPAPSPKPTVSPKAESAPKPAASPAAAPAPAQEAKTRPGAG